MVFWANTSPQPKQHLEAIKMLFGLRTWVGSRNHVLDGVQIPLMGRGSYNGKKGRPTVKYSDYLPWAVQKWLNRSRCHVGFGLGGPQVACIKWGCTVASPGEYHWIVHVWQQCGPLSNYFNHLFKYWHWKVLYNIYTDAIHNHIVRGKLLPAGRIQIIAWKWNAEF